jgi:hypothetical protein
MARADRDARTRNDAACARCHTTWGALNEPERKPPAQMGALGIGCAACHAVHPPSKDARVGRVCTAALPRDADVPGLIDGHVPAAAAKSRVCLTCHTPTKDEAFPSASTAALWLGRGGLDPETGSPLDGPAPHDAVAGGCIGCHRGGPDGLGKGTNHGFAADATACAACHAPKGDPTLSGRAHALWTRFGTSATTDVATPDIAHATPTSLDRSTPKGRALYDLALVVEDARGVAAHNAPYARRLLDAAERTLTGGAR